MAVLGKKEILAWRKPVMKTLAVPEWGGEVCIRRLSGDGRDAWDLFNVSHKDPETKRLKADTRQYRATLVALSLCDEQGRSLDFTPEEVIALGEDDGVVLDRLFDECYELSALSVAAAEDLKKNSEPPPSDSSGT